jgi:hypothetical protein
MKMMMVLSQGARMRNKEQQEPCVGIFWFFDGKLIIDTTPLSKAEPYGDHLGHPISHIDYWTKLQREGVVPPESEYEENPRGRVGYDKREERFWLRADRCILQKKALVSRIMRVMNLSSSKTQTEKDDHYQCEVCLRRR